MELLSALPISFKVHYLGQFVKHLPFCQAHY